MPQASPTVTLGLVVYNGERYLAAALDSILAQEYRDFEVVLSDNASTDGTEAICRSYAARDPRIRYERHEINRGASWNCNYVIDAARGRYVKITTHDDVLLPGHLRRCVETFESGPDRIAIVFPSTLLIDSDGAVIEEYDDRIDLRQASPARRLASLVRNMRLANPIVGLMRRDFLARTGRFRNIVGSDNLLLAEMSLLGEIWRIPDRLYQRRMHTASSSEVYPSLKDRMRWLDPFKRGFSVSFPVTQLYLEHLRIIRAAPIGGGERLAAYVLFTLAHAYSRIRHRAWELRTALRRRARRLKRRLSR